MCLVDDVIVDDAELILWDQPPLIWPDELAFRSVLLGRVILSELLVWHPIRFKLTAQLLQKPLQY